MAGERLKITFHGGAGEVTGANFLIELPSQAPVPETSKDKGFKILVDCGLVQGQKIGEDKNREDFPYNPAEIDYLLITHAHIDHIGRIPKLVKEGFRGKIISSPPTKDIAELMLEDSMGVLGKEARHDKLPPLYEKKDVELAMSLWQGIDHHEVFEIGPIKVRQLIAGHILGSSMFEFNYNGKKLVITGDLGNSPAPLLRPTEALENVDYLLTESVYGDRNHEGVEERKELLENVIEENCKRRGTLMIPAFSLERTQEILYEIEQMMERNRIPLLPVYLDSPLAIKVTDIYKKYDHLFNKDAQGYIKSSDDIFSFPQLKITMETEQSKAIDQDNNPKIIIAGSGMSNGGRIVHHEKRFLPDPKSTLLLVGYQAIRTLGRRLQEGAKRVKIHDREIDVRARIVNIRGYSAHKDSDGLLDFISTTADSLKLVMVCMGEPKSSMFLVQRMRDFMGIKAVVPKEHETIELDFSKQE